MPMLERLELARAVASRQPGGAQAFLEVEDWRPLLDFTQGNPLTVTILARQALRAHHTTREQIEGFVEQLRAGAAAVTDDAAQGRGASLAASLDYGFTQAFTDPERATLALLALFQGFIDIDTLRHGRRRRPGARGGRAGPRDRDRAAGPGRRNRPAHRLRRRDTTPSTPPSPGTCTPCSPATTAPTAAPPPSTPPAPGPPPPATSATTTTTSTTQGDTEVIGVLGGGGGQPAARPPAWPSTHHWHDLILGPMQGLRTLYEPHRAGHRMAAARRRAHPRAHRPRHRRPPPRPRRAMGHAHQLPGPHRPGRPRLGRRPETPRRRHRLATASRPPPPSPSPPTNSTTSSATRSATSRSALRELGQILREQDDPGCVQPYHEAMELFQRIGDRRARSHRRAQPRARLQGHPRPARPRPGRALVPARPRAARRARHPRPRTRSSASSATSPTSGSTTPGPPGHPRNSCSGTSTTRPAPTTRNSACSPTTRSTSSPSTHHALGDIYGDAGDTDRPRALPTRPSTTASARTTATAPAGPGYNAAVTLANAGRRHDALLYARAALRDYRTPRPRRRRQRRPGTPAHHRTRTRTAK